MNKLNFNECGCEGNCKGECDYCNGITASLRVYNITKFSKEDKKLLIKWLKTRIKEFKREKDYKIFVKNPLFRLMK